MWRLLLGWLLLVVPGLAHAGEATLEIGGAGGTKTITRAELLARPDVTDIDVPADVAYGRAMTYRAVPVASLLQGLDSPAGSVIEAVATDGFVAQIPADLMHNTDKSKPVAWLAIEPADKPWPKIAGKDYTAGPFYVVWLGPAVRSEYWAYQTVKLMNALPPAIRWPQIAVDASLPPSDPARKGEALYIAQCLPCHKVNRGGASDVGPDLNLPMNATEYMTPKGLHKLIRDPKSVRCWPDMKMNGWSPDLLSDEEIDNIIAYLGHMAGRRPAQ
jgi:mono/diheme cytochrome c family protein